MHGLIRFTFDAFSMLLFDGFDPRLDSAHRRNPSTIYQPKHGPAFQDWCEHLGVITDAGNAVEGIKAVARRLRDDRLMLKRGEHVGCFRVTVIWSRVSTLVNTTDVHVNKLRFRQPAQYFMFIMLFFCFYLSIYLKISKYIYIYIYICVYYDD